MSNGSVAFRSKYASRGLERIDAYKVLFAFVCLAFLKPSICEYYDLWDVSFNLIRFGLSILYFILYFFASKGRLNKKIIGLLLIFLLVVYNSFRYSGDIYKVASHFIPAIGFLAFTDYYIDKIQDIIEVIFYEFGLLIILNLLSMIWYPAGILTEGNLGYTRVWLLGQKQSWAFCCIPFVFCGNIIKKIDSRASIFYWSCVGCLCVSLLKAAPLGLIINLMIVIVFSFLNDKFNFKISTRFLVAILLIGAIGSILIAIRYDDLYKLQSFLGSINAVGMGKDKTIRVRADMWLTGIKMFMAHPFLGVGRPSWKMVRSYGGIIYHTNLHNMFIDIITTTGLFGLFLYILYIFGDIKKFAAKYTNDIVFILAISILGICIENMTECLYSPFCFWILSLGQHADVLADLLPKNYRKQYIRFIF